MKNKKILILTIVIAISCIVALITLNIFKNNNKSENNENKNNDEIFSRVEKVNIEIENYGTISLDLYPNVAPLTVKNFISLVKEGFYDGLTFHRIIDGFMMQGGAPSGTGSSGNDRKINGEFEANGFKNPLKHERGVISMARRGNDYNSASSQFFIVQTTYPSLDGLYASFGKVTSGIEIVDKICKETKVEDRNGTVLKENQPRISRIYVVE